MKAIPITQRCKSPMKLDETTLAAAAQGNPKFKDSAAGMVVSATEKFAPKKEKKDDE